MHSRRHIALVSGKISIFWPMPNTAICQISGEALAFRHHPPLWEACRTQVFFCDHPLPNTTLPLNQLLHHPTLSNMALPDEQSHPAPSRSDRCATHICLRPYKLTDLVLRPEPSPPTSTTTTSKTTTNTTKSGATGTAASLTLPPSPSSSVSAASQMGWMTY